MNYDNYDMVNSSFKNITKLIKHNTFSFEVHTSDNNIYRLKIKEKIVSGQFNYIVECDRLDQKQDQWIKVLVPAKECDTEQESLISALNWLNEDK